MNNPKSSSTFGKYARNEIGGEVNSMSMGVNQLDIAFEVYSKDSTKKQACDGRVKKGGATLAISNKTPVYCTMSKTLDSR